MFKNSLLFIVSIIITLIISELIAIKVFEPTITQVVYKGDSVGGKESQFKSSEDDRLLLYEPKYFPQTISVKKNICRVIVLGDSITCLDIKHIDSYYPALLQGLLNSHFPARKYEVINAGVAGYNANQEARYLEKRLISYAPDMVIVGYDAINDRTRKRKMIKYNDGLYCSDIIETYPSIRLPFGINRLLIANSALYRWINFVFIKIVNKMQLKFISHRIEYVDLTSETEAAIKKIKNISYEKKIDLIFVIFPFLEKGSRDECDWVINKCEEYGIKYIDLRNIFEKAGYENLRISNRDFVHPNELGHKLTAEAIFEYLNKHNKQMKLAAEDYELY